MSLVASGAAHQGLASPPGAPPPPNLSGQVQTNTSAPVEWILLFLAVVALGFADWLWSHWGRPQPPAAAAR